MESGAIKAPIDAPALKILVAYARSFFGKYSAVTFIAAGKLPASPKANTQRATIKHHMLTVAIIVTVAPVAATISAAPLNPNQDLVIIPHKA